MRSDSVPHRMARRGLTVVALLAASVGVALPPAANAGPIECDTGTIGSTFVETHVEPVLTHMSRTFIDSGLREPGKGYKIYHERTIEAQAEFQHSGEVTANAVIRKLGLAANVSQTVNLALSGSKTMSETVEFSTGFENSGVYIFFYGYTHVRGKWQGWECRSGKVTYVSQYGNPETFHTQDDGIINCAEPRPTFPPMAVKASWFCTNPSGVNSAAPSQESPLMAIEAGSSCFPRDDIRETPIYSSGGGRLAVKRSDYARDGIGDLVGVRDSDGQIGRAHV